MIDLYIHSGRGNLSISNQNAEDGGTIGRDLSDVAEATLRLAAELRPMLDEDAVTVLDQLVQDEQNDACRIAVIGQVKAGKSTLINALVRRPGLLPANVNPWTAVVTNLHFGRQSDVGAVYQFFDESDWQHLAGGGRLQELSLRLGIALDADTLASQVRSMRERAEQRLGRRFQQLLGKQHRFASASAEVLERYVCVGNPDSTGGQEPKLGRFADITKSADLYFDLPPFGYATTIVDTPGTNDPFLVRDELSREALRSADAYIIVLNAQQALSSSDLDLLRLLHGLQKSRLLIFVNRVDLLSNPAADAETVVAHIRSKLDIEFPGAVIPIVAGSAAWTESAMASSAMASNDITVEMEGRSEAAGFWTGRKSSAGTVSGRAQPRNEIMRSAGFDDLLGTLSRLVVQGPTMMRLRRRRHALRDMVSKVDFAARGELLSLERRISAVRDDEAAKAHRHAKAVKDVERFTAAPEAVGKLIEAAISDLARAKDAAVRLLDNALRDIIRRHAATARETLLAQSRFIREDHIWQYPALPLRRDLERAFQKIYQDAAQRLQLLVEAARAAILEEIGDLLPANRLAGQNTPIYTIDPEPSISALGQTVAIELDDQWRAWWRLWHGQKQRARKLEELLIAEFGPVVDALVDAAEAEFAAQVTISIQRFTQLARDVVVTLDRCRFDLLSDRSDQAKDRPNALMEYQRRKRVLEEQIRNCARIADALSLLFNGGDASGPAANPLHPG
jgi:signal recognition particle receptor subunit beta